MADQEPAETGKAGNTGTGSVRAKRRVRPSGFKVITALAVWGLLGYLAFAFLPMFGGGNGASTQGTIPVASAPVRTPAPTPTLTAVPEAASLPPVPSGPPAAPPQRLLYPAAGIDVPVLPLDPDSFDGGARTIVPPATIDGYWLTPYGMPGADSANTTYVVGHSWQDLEAPFNRLSTHAAAGDRLSLATSAGTVEYKVDSVTRYEKSSLKDSPIWEVAPHRLVLISCYTDDLWGTNVVVVASPA